MNKPPLRVAPIGLGGFAGRHHQSLYALEQEGVCRVVAACDPEPEKFAGFMSGLEFESRRIPVYTHHRDMLAAHSSEIDFVVVSTPIDLHASMHRDCIELGLPCFLEKPPTLFWEEFEQMLKVEAEAQVETLVGFSYIVEQPRLHLKQRLVDGDFGRVIQASFYGVSPRDTVYYERAPWVGRLMLDDRIILDSCLGNALAHFVHNILFWCGQDEFFHWEPVKEMEAEFYRSHRIENFDTCFARGTCENGIKIRIAGTHSGVRDVCCREVIECEKATIHYESGPEVTYSIHWHDGRVESESESQVDLLRENLRQYMAFLRGEVQRPLTRMIDSRPFVHLYSLLYVAAGKIHDIPEEFLKWEGDSPPYGEWVTIVGLEEAMQEFSATGRFPGEAGTPWGRAGGQAKASEMNRLEEAVHAMVVRNRERRKAGQEAPL